MRVLIESEKLENNRLGTLRSSVKLVHTLLSGESGSRGGPQRSAVVWEIGQLWSDCHHCSGVAFQGKAPHKVKILMA